MLIRSVLIQLIPAGTLWGHFCHSLDLFLDFLSSGISSRGPGSPPIPTPTPKSRITADKQPKHHFWDTNPDPKGICPQIWVDFPCWASNFLCLFGFFLNPPKIGIKLPHFSLDWISYVCLFLEGHVWSFLGFGIFHPSRSFPAFS